MKILLLKLLSLFSVLFLTIVSSHANNGGDLFSPYPKAKLSYSQSMAGEESRILVAYFPQKKGAARFTFKQIIGDVRRYQYNVNNVSTLALYENYKHALDEAGFNIGYQCSGAACGDERAQKKLGKASAFFNVYNQYHKARYIYATKEGDEPYAVSLFLGQYKKKSSAFLSVVAIKPVDTGLMTADIKAYRQLALNQSSKQKKDDIEGAKDHPLLSRYPGSHIQSYHNMDYDEISLPIGIQDTKTKLFPLLDIVGDITQITYIKHDVSTLKIYQNYVATLTKDGFEPVFSCEKEGCGLKRDNKSQLGDLIAKGQVYNFYHRPRYQLMQNTVDGQTTYVGIFVGHHHAQTRTQLVIARTEPLQKGLITTNTEQILKQLEQKGKASVYGIFFDFDKSVVKAQSNEALAVIKQVLASDKALQIYVVGHTDDKGSASYNLQLSQRRAAAVVDKLIKEYGIAASRLIAYGAGPYSPVATNRNDLGRQLNRRVELVERLAK